jgi:hypothetical protein
VNVLIIARIMWPALIFAARRKDSVTGRTRILTVSIRIKGGASQEGAPVGRRWAVVYMGCEANDDIINASQRGSPNVRVNRRWFVGPNLKGISPIRLRGIIKTERDLRIKILGLRFFACVRRDCRFMVSA